MVFTKDGDKTVKDVMSEFGLTQPQAKFRLKKLNLPYINVRKAHDVSEYTLFIVDYIKNNNKTIVEIMDTFNISENKTRYLINKYGLTFSKENHRHSLRNSQIIELLKEDVKTYVEIGEIFGITKQRVRELAYKNGYKRHEIRRIKYTKIAKEISSDIESGMVYSDIRKKYTYKVISNVCNRGLLSNVNYYAFKKSKNKRLSYD